MKMIKAALAGAMMVAGMATAMPAYAVSYLYEFTASGFRNTQFPEYQGPQSYIVDVYYDPAHPGYNRDMPLYTDEYTSFADDTNLYAHLLYQAGRGTSEIEVSSSFDLSTGMASGSFLYSLPHFTRGGNEGVGNITSVRRYTHGDIGSSYVYFNLLSSVPEPATWAMMIAGFGMVGAAARGRKRRAIVAA